MRTFLFFCFLICMPIFAATEKEKIVKACIEYTDEEIIDNKAPQCKKAIANYLQKVFDDKIPRFDRGLYSFLSIALRSEMPMAYKVIEKEIYEGYLNEWIDKLEELNFELYGNSLTKWARHVESEIRKFYKIEQTKKGAYTVGEENTTNITQLTGIWSPILMTKYLDFLLSPSHQVDVKDFSSIDIIYAFSTSSFREIFAEQISKVILKASDQWVNSVRKEQAWVLFRLFAVIPKNSDGNIKRELLWLEHYHPDFRIRSMASTTLAKTAIE